MTLESDVVPRPQLYDIASSVFAQKLSQVKGVGQVQVGGSSLPAVRVEVNPQPLSDYNVGLDQIGTFLQQRQCQPAERLARERRRSRFRSMRATSFSWRKTTRISWWSIGTARRSACRISAA